MDWIIPIGTTAILFAAFPFIGKHVIEPYCVWANRVASVRMKKLDERHQPIRSPDVGLFRYRIPRVVVFW